ncbi:hypothetical protein [Roseinatronobacter sp. NSM]|uniref:hypothetical protein n=1 Tax=Roseinatronobacter sp. NSM TaxID=3457785 RepID=UPI004036E438
MDQYLIFLVPYLAIGVLALISCFDADNFPEWLAELCVFNSVMVSGIWASGVAVIMLALLGVPVGLAMIIGLPVAYFTGRMMVGKP